ncbi:MAG: diphosphate--fructose-6-phosphate 1-phosphotransferase [Parachlamydiales bacterium]|jgi:pyrophosphate--fructose-6-phosphate 1-phosphotransferase
MENISLLQKLRLKYQPSMPKILQDISSLNLDIKGQVLPASDIEDLRKLFPETFGGPIVLFKKANKKSESKTLRVGVVFSGGQASGGHNVISGLFDSLKSLNSQSRLFGFLNGPSGIVDCKTIELDKKTIDSYRNLGGFDMIGSGRTKIESDDQLEKSLKCAKDLNLDAIVVIGGDDSNTNAAILAEYFKKNKIQTKVIGVPKTIDGDLRSENIEISFGFDTACKVYAELIGNIARDALSAKKYYHFIRLMGRSASHIALECALKTNPNLVLIAEEIFHKKKTLNIITEEIADLIQKRSEKDKNYGIILIPEGLIEFIPEFKKLISDLNRLLAIGQKTEENFNKLTSLNDKFAYIKKLLDKDSANCFVSLPDSIKTALLLDRDPHGNVKVSQIETEKLLIETTESELKKRGFKGKFNALNHFFGYEGRAGFPSNFDANYCYNLGVVSTLLINNNLSGYMSCIGNLTDSIDNWIPKGIPITSLMNIEMRNAKQKPVIKKSLVELDSKAFKYIEANKERWGFDDLYAYPGSIQYFGDKEITDSIPKSLSLNLFK